MLRKKLAIFIARRKKMNFAVVAKGKTGTMYSIKEKGGFCSKEKSGFCTIAEENQPYLYQEGKK